MSHVTDRSRVFAERLRSSLPGGDTRTGTFYAPFPVTLARGEGCRLWDVDGNEYIDCVNNFTSLVHGNAHPQIVAALHEQATLGTALAAPTRLQAEVAERISDRVSSVERVRFANSGSEANLVAVRAARAYTGRDEIVKAHGGYHGLWEQLPVAFPGRGIPLAVQELAHEVDFNDIEQLETVMAQRGERIAAIVLEPVMLAGGVILGDPAFLAAAQRLAAKYGALFLLDEVVTFRLDRGGWQAVVGIEPDLTTFAKVIGGGLPIGAVGGRADVLEVFDPRTADHVVHSGTFNGNSMSLAAGGVSLDLLTAEEIRRINELGDRLAAGLQAAVPESHVTSVGSCVQVHFGTTAPIRRYRDTNMSSSTLRAFHRAGLERGVFFAARGLLNTSTAMDEAVIDAVIDRLADAADAVRQLGAVA